MNSISALRRLRGPIAIAMVVVFTASAAAAQGPAPALAPAEATSEARTHFDRGVAFYDESDYAAALVEFKRAYALAPTWQVLFNIGQAYFQIRNYALALVTLTRFLEEGHDRIPEARRATVEAERADLANRVGHANIESNRPGATITIDDEEVGVTPLGGPALVSVGLRKVKAMAPGNQPARRGGLGVGRGHGRRPSRLPRRLAAARTAAGGRVHPEARRAGRSGAEPVDQPGPGDRRLRCCPGGRRRGRGLRCHGPSRQIAARGRVHGEGVQPRVPAGHQRRGARRIPSPPSRSARPPSPSS